MLHGFGNGYTGKESALSSRCAMDDAQYNFFHLSISKFISIFKFEYLNYDNISSDIN